MKRKKSKFGAFLVAFFFSLVGLAILVGTVFLVGGEPNKNENVNSLPNAVNTYKPAADEELNVLLIGCSSRGVQAKGYALLRFDSVRRSIAVCALPDTLESTVNLKTDTLAGLYDYGGPEMAMQAAGNAFGVHVNRYLRLDLDSFTQIIDWLGGLSYTVENPVTTGKGSSAVRVEAGEQLLNASRLYALVSNAKLRGTEQLMRIQTDLLASAIRQYLTPRMAEAPDAAYNLLLSLADTSITHYDYTYRKDALVYIASAPGGCAVPLYLRGERREGRFIPSADVVEEVRTAFTRAEPA